MQLPHELQRFPVATLLVASDRMSAQFWLLGGDALEALDGLSLPSERDQDHEGSYVSSDGSRTGSSDTGNEDDERFHRYLHLLTEQVEQLVRTHQIARLHLVMPADIAHALTSHVSPDIAARIGTCVAVSAMKESPLDLIRRVLSV